MKKWTLIEQVALIDLMIQYDDAAFASNILGRSALEIRDELSRLNALASTCKPDDFSAKLFKEHGRIFESVQQFGNALNKIADLVDNNTPLSSVPDLDELCFGPVGVIH